MRPRVKYASVSDVEVEAVGADLSKPGFMDALDQVTHDKCVQLLFCNAGFMLSGFFHATPMGANKANAAVNVGCHLELTHEYVNRMIAAGKRARCASRPLPGCCRPQPLPCTLGQKRL